MTDKTTDASLGDRLFTAVQKCLPTHLMSRVVHWFMRIETAWIKNFVITSLMARFRITLEECEIADPLAFRSFNEFFTRALKPGARPAPGDPRAVACPVDGRLYQCGRVEAGRIFQAKGQWFDLVELLGGDNERARPFQDGGFATLYLAPHNYHRIHMPLGGVLRQMVYVPGRLFSVNPATARAMPNLFARNERVAAIFETELGPMAVVLVGALHVGSIETVWAGEVTPPARNRIEVTDYAMQGTGAIALKRSAELGRFNMGSTVIVVFGPKAVRWAEGLATGQPVRVGQVLAAPI